MAITDRRHWFGATSGDTVATVNEDSQLVLAPGVTLEVHEAESGANRILDLLDEGGTPTDVVVSDTVGRIRFRADLGRTQVWVASPPSAEDPDPERTLLTATDLDEDVVDLDTRVETIEGGAVVADHGNLTGLVDDDHTQYHNDARGDVRYFERTVADGRFIRTVNGQGPDGGGNVVVDAGGGDVQTVNGLEPDGGGNITLNASSVGAPAVDTVGLMLQQSGPTYPARSTLTSNTTTQTVIYVGAATPADFEDGLDIWFRTP